MKKILSLTLAALFAVSVCAKPVDHSAAIRVAQNFAKSQVKMADYSATIVYTHTMPNSGQPAMYAVNVGNSAFVIVAADDVAHPVLGYNMSRPWPTVGAYPRVRPENVERIGENGEPSAAVQLPSQVSGFLDDLANQINAAMQQNVVQDRNIAAEWQRLLTDELPAFSPLLSAPDSVGPLLTTTWDQGQYYNALCPEDANGPAGHVWTGCVATAMAQIINYWGYPVHGRGSHSYQHNTYGTLSVNYDSATYDYAQMPDALTSTSTPQEINAVAKLMYDCGVAVNMDYAYSESGSYVVEARAGLINYFKFSPNLSYAEKNYFTDDEWNTLLMENLDVNQPIYYSGHSNQGGHSFVCDGYNANNFYHFNYGWSGYADGWYLTSAVNPAFYDFNSTQSALVGIIPDSNGLIVLGQTTGYSTFMVDNQFEYYHILGHNLYEGSNTEYSCGFTVSFLSNDTNNIVVDVLSLINGGCLVYDGLEQTNFLESFQFYHTRFDPVISITNAVTLRSGGGYGNEGFHIHIQKNGDCRLVSNVETRVDTNAVYLSWQENGISDSWEIEYGVKGFSQGTGIIQTVNTTATTIQGLNFNQQYDFYIRPACGSIIGGMWNKVSATPDKPYWHEIVTEQPNGYFTDTLGNVYIYTAEGLAWFNVQANGYNGESIHYFDSTTIYLMADCDMGQYKWMPIYYFRGTLDGRNHTISNLYINEDRHSDLSHNMYSVGMFRMCRDNALIQDLTLYNPFVTGGGGVGALIGSLQPMDQSYNTPDDENGATLRNVHTVSANIRGMAWVGGLVGEAEYLNAYNCSSSGMITGTQSIGGLFGLVRFSHCINLFSTATIGLIRGEGIPVWNRGGLIGTVNSYYDTNYISNCYASGVVNIDTLEFNSGYYLGYGKVIGNPEGHNRFSYLYGYNINPTLPICDQYWSYPETFPVVSDTSVFIRNNDNFNLTTPVIINDQEYTDLLSALNAWVDANDTAGIYRRWAADSANVNGGFPVFAALPCTPTSSSDTVYVCENYTWHGNVYTASTELIDTLVNFDGCDSIVTHYLIVNQPIHTASTETACDGYIWNGTTYGASGDYTYSHTDNNGCTQVDTLHLTINNSTTGDTTAIACEIFTWQGTTYSVSGDVQGGTLIQNAAGCDSVVTLHLTINNPVHTATSETACETYTWNGTDYTVSGDYTYSNADANGCTQVDTLHLTINHNTTGDTTATACESFTWQGTTYYVSGNVHGGTPLQNSAGCDSTVTLHLTINNPVHTASTETACDGYIWNGTTYGASGDYTYSHTDANGCTQVDTLHLTINNSTTGDTTAIACESFTWQGTTYSVSGDVHGGTPLQNAAGCDSVVTLHLTINNPVHTATIETACETYTWNGTAYTVSGDYTYSHADANGCTQVDTLHLTINHNTTGDTTAIACESFTWQGTTYYVSGDVHGGTPLQNTAGCDSVVTLHLTINNPVHMATTEVACETYTWNGTDYTVSGDYTYSHADANGCTQVDTLHLTINYSVVAYDSITIASTELPYDYHGNTIDAGGDYTFTGATTEGCDSTMHLNVIVNQVGIDDIALGTEIRVYPNPTDGDVIVEGRGVERIEVMDVAGRVIIDQRYEGATDCRIDISAFGQGAYLLRVTTVDSVTIRKVVKR